MRKSPLLALLMVGVVVLAGTASAYTSKASDTVTITWWDWGSNPQVIIDQFERTHPDINVVAQNVGTGEVEYTKLLTAIRAGSGAPDLVQIDYGALPQFVATGGLRNLVPLGVNKYRKLFPAAPWRQVTFNQGGVYGIPVDIGPLAMFYKSDTFAKYGLKVPKTWAEYQAAATKLRNATSDITMTTFDSNEWRLFLAMAASAGAVPFNQTGAKRWTLNIASPEMIKVGQFWGSLVSKGLAKRDVLYSADFGSNLANGKYATLIGAAWSPAYEIGPFVKPPTGWRAAPLPQWKAGQPFDSGIGWGGSTFAVTSQSKNPAAALEFARWITTTTSGIRWMAASPGQKGRGAYPAALAAKGSTILNEPTPSLDGQRTAALFSSSAKAMNARYQWSPWGAYFGDRFKIEADKAVSGSQTWRQALLNVESAVAAFARQQGFTVTIAKR